MRDLPHALGYSRQFPLLSRAADGDRRRRFAKLGRVDFRWLPSPVGLGVSLIIPGLLNIPTAVGSFLSWLWQRRAPKSYGRYCITLASGLIGGDAIISGLLLPILFYFGVLAGG